MGKFTKTSDQSVTLGIKKKNIISELSFFSHKFPYILNLTNVKLSVNIINSLLLITS